MHHIIDEIIMGGMVVETNLHEIIEAYQAQNKMEKAPQPKVVSVGPNKR